MTTYIYDHEQGNLVEKTPKVRSGSGPFFLPDIEPYESPITGKTIHSRSERRDELRRHDCIDTRDLKGEVLANGQIHKG